MKITKKHLTKFHNKLQKIVDEIQELADDCAVEEGEADLAEDLWTAQAQIEDARQTLDGF